MSDLFDIYQENLKQIFLRIDKTFSEVDIGIDVGKKLKEIEYDLAESEKLIKNLEIQLATGGCGPNHSSYMRSYKSGYDTYRKRFLKAKDKHRTESNGKAIDLVSAGKHEEVAYNSFEKLERAKRATIEMENIGSDVMIELDGQGEQMKGITSKVNDMGDELTTSTGLISEMQARELKNRNILIWFSVFLAVMFIIICIIRLWPKGQIKETPTQ